MGAFAEEVLLLERSIRGKICPKGIITDAQEMRRIYLEEFGTPSACITYGANIESSANPDLVRQYGLEPNQYYLIASRMVPENNADLIIEAFNRLRHKPRARGRGQRELQERFRRKIDGPRRKEGSLSRARP